MRHVYKHEASGQVYKYGADLQMILLTFLTHLAPLNGTPFSTVLYTKVQVKVGC